MFLHQRERITQEENTRDNLNLQVLKSKMIPGLTAVNRDSSEADIMHAIDTAGEFIATTKPAHREWDWRESEGNYYTVMKIYHYAFVHWYDISEDLAIIPRLMDMVKRGVLEGSLLGTIVPVSHLRVRRPTEQYRR